MDISYTGHGFNKANIARALFGNASDVAGATVVDEVRVAYKGALLQTGLSEPKRRYRQALQRHADLCGQH